MGGLGFMRRPTGCGAGGLGFIADQTKARGGGNFALDATRKPGHAPVAGSQSARRAAKRIITVAVVAPVRVAVPREWTLGQAADGERGRVAVRLRGQTPVDCVAVVGKARAGAS